MVKQIFAASRLGAKTVNANRKRRVRVGPMLCRGYMCNYCMQRAAIPVSNMLEITHEAKVLQPMTAFAGIT